MSDEVSKLLRGDLVRLGLTQEEFASKLGVTQQAVSAWYARNAVPHGRLKAIEGVLGSDSQLVSYMRQQPRPQERLFEDRPIRRVRVPTENRITSLGGRNVVAQLTQERQRFRDLIESALPGARIDVLVETGHVNRQFDYLSDSLCIELILLTPIEGRIVLNSPRVYQKLVSLMLCRQLTSEDFPGRHFGIVVIANDLYFGNSPHVSRLQWECEQFDITLTVVSRVEEAAEFIIEIENSLAEFDEPDDTDQ